MQLQIHPKTTLFLFILLLTMNVFGQQNCKIYFSGRTYITFFEDGSFLENRESTILHIPYQYTIQDTISYGSYKKHGRWYYLTSAQAIAGIDSVEIVQNKCNPQDSIFIEIKSPYTQIIKTYPQSSLYIFQVSIDYKTNDIKDVYSHPVLQQCNDFTFIFPDDTTGLAEGIIISVFPHKQFFQYNYSYNPSPLLEIHIDHIDFHNNHFIINLPNFGYLTLSYINYSNYRIKKIGTNKLFLHGKIYTRYNAAKENRKSGVSIRKELKTYRHYQSY